MAQPMKNLLKCIDRLGFLQAKFPCRENAIVITKLERKFDVVEQKNRRQIETKC